MSCIGVITGDIVNSTEILKSGNREKLLEVLKNTVKEINSTNQTHDIKMEIYRGDSFQIVVKYPVIALKVAIIIRVALIANSEGGSRWDARLGIGIGEGEFIVDSIAESDGEAFHKSGQAFDTLDRSSRMAVYTPDDDFSNELSVSTAFADDIITNWTETQAAVIYPFMLKSPTQKDLAEMVGKSPQVVSKLLSASKLLLISNYEKRYQYKLDQ
ncbi:MAG: SatD family protein [Candidatus Symbiothrix sp.]|jgi:hypothetical protein|nr:SatD family protein [Candidatus Symbiothrix sp.]